MKNISCKCQECKKKYRRNDGYSRRYCSKECQVADSNRRKLIQKSDDDSGNYYDNFVDGKGY